MNYTRSAYIIMKSLYDKPEGQKTSDLIKNTGLSRATVILNLLQLARNDLLIKLKEKQYLVKSRVSYKLSDLGKEKLSYLQKLQSSESENKSNDKEVKCRSGAKIF